MSTIAHKVKQTIEQEQRYDIALAVIRKLENGLRGIVSATESYKGNNTATMCFHRASNTLYRAKKLIKDRKP